MTSVLRTQLLGIKMELSTVKRVAKHLSKYMLLYTTLAILIGTFVSYKYSPTFLSKYVPIIVFLMLYPMMVNISFENLKKIKQYRKAIGLALIYNFVMAPAIYYFLCNIFGSPVDVLTAMLLLAVAPASSMGIGYVGLAEGNVALASVIVATAFIFFLIISPVVVHIISSSYYSIPFREVVENLIFVLILPLVFGVSTRELLIEKRGMSFDKVKPIFSLITLVFLYILIFVIFALKGKMILEHPYKVVIVAPLATLFYVLMLAMEYIINKYLIKLDYKDFQAIVFTTVSKNVALTIALLSTLFKEQGHLMATYPAIVSILQIIFLVTYLHFSLQRLTVDK